MLSSHQFPSLAALHHAHPCNGPLSHQEWKLTAHPTPHRGLLRVEEYPFVHTHDSWTTIRLRGRRPNVERRNLYHSIYFINTSPLSNVTVHNPSQHLAHTVHHYFIPLN